MKLALILTMFILAGFFNPGITASVGKSFESADEGPYPSNFYRQYFLRYQKDQADKITSRRNATLAATAGYPSVMFVGHDGEPSTEDYAHLANNISTKFISLRTICQRHFGDKKKVEWSIPEILERDVLLSTWIMPILSFLLIAMLVLCWPKREDKGKLTFERLEDDSPTQKKDDELV